MRWRDPSGHAGAMHMFGEIIKNMKGGFKLAGDMPSGTKSWQTWSALGIHASGGDYNKAVRNLQGNINFAVANTQAMAKQWIQDPVENFMKDLKNNSVAEGLLSKFLLGTDQNIWENLAGGFQWAAKGISPITKSLKEIASGGKYQKHDGKKYHLANSDTVYYTFSVLSLILPPYYGITGAMIMGLSKLGIFYGCNKSLTECQTDQPFHGQ